MRSERTSEERPMARILENPYGGRRMIRLSGEDVMMVVSTMQQALHGKGATYQDVYHVLSSQPLYLPEETH